MSAYIGAVSTWNVNHKRNLDITEVAALADFLVEIDKLRASKGKARMTIEEAHYAMQEWYAYVYKFGANT